MTHAGWPKGKPKPPAVRRAISDGVRRAARERVEHLRTADRLIDAAVSAETAEACIKSLWGALEALMKAVPRPAEMDAPPTRRRSLPYTIPVDADELIAMVRQNGDGR